MCKHKGVQDQNKYTLEDYKYCLENSEIMKLIMVLTILLEVINMKLQW